jgi:hypothetical protein
MERRCREVYWMSTHLVVADDDGVPFGRLPITERFADGMPAPTTYLFRDVPRRVSNVRVYFYCGELAAAEVATTGPLSVDAGMTLRLDFNGVRLP